MPRGSTGRPLVLRLAAALAVAGALTGCAPAAERSGPRAAGEAEAAASDGPAGTTGFDRALHDRLPAAVRAQGRIRVATDAGYAPASFFDEDGRTIIGFEPDLAAALGRVLGVQLAFVRMDFKDTLPALQAGEVEAVMAAMTDTPERQQQVDFVDYFAAGTSIVVQRGNPHAIDDLDDLCGHTVAAEEGTTQVELLEGLQPSCSHHPIVVRQFPDNDSVLVELRSGRAAAVLNDYPPAVRLTTDERTRADFQLASTVQYEPGLYGIAVRKQDTGLRDALREALDRLVRSGEYERVLDTWGVSSGALRDATVNGGT